MKLRKPRIVSNPKAVARHSRVVWLSGAGFVFSALQAGLACLASDPPFGPIPFAVATTVVSLGALVLPFLANRHLSGDQA
ncbi:hypothetical protein LPC10_17720 [Methylorubrum sp. B1-46]|uniref:hypothetical protein n=1 Tax=Methylorubrum TaxID=2282523 RepID=UPI001E34DBD9|nr:MULTISPECIES: hypothetical protein [Methylorubrum]MCG5246869.1 hypothetical protein [Methylorubrum extorquens]UGB24769.1 hypothetical protein LPC10_17720 [Methylorubrum sp. B1-46]